MRRFTVQWGRHGKGYDVMDGATYPLMGGQLVLATNSYPKAIRVAHDRNTGAGTCGAPCPICEEA